MVSPIVVPAREKQVHPRVPLIQTPHVVDTHFTSIPTSDPEAALEFCRSLASLLAGTPTLLELPRPRLHTSNVSVHNPGPHRAQPELSPDSTMGASAALEMCELSIVIPVYNEEENLSCLYNRLTTVLTTSGMDYEIVFVDDGSRDSSLEQLGSLAAEDGRVVVVELARNFGHQVAISAGLDHARGQGVMIMDADLQDPPEVIPQFIAKWREGHDVVYAIREQRKESWIKRAAYSTFYRLLQRVANIEIPLDAGDFCIMDRRVVDLLAEMPERNRFVRGIRSWVGLKQVGLAYERQARFGGKPKYTFGRLVHLALDGLIAFSCLPLRAITLLGFSVSLLSIMLGLFYAFKKLTYGLNPPGFATLVVSIFFLAGIQLITMGVIGEYVGRIFEEVKRRPLYVVRGVLGRRAS